MYGDTAMKRGLILGAFAVVAVALMFNSNVEGVGDKDKVPTVKEIMSGCMKSGLCKKVMDGKGDDAEKEKLLKMLSQLAANKAPAGTDDTNWKKMTAEIKDACKTGDLKKVQASLKCQVCHKEYKGK
jgi:hypothetical protein